ncbi:MAG: tripartite tricarboxylate transporter TctB family protein [Alphaproteobacteria bacterium]|nr:tripartite tricarboxylate transporter TctB family protein [Alphaproteobacteria bacterium]
MSDHPAPAGERAPSPRADLLTAAVLLAFSIGVIVLSAGMPTFTDKGASLFLAPGIVPGFYGSVLTLLALVLAARSIWRGALRGDRGAGTASGAGDRAGLLRLGIAVVLCLVFAVGLIGLVPFWLAVALFVTSFIVIFEWQPGLGASARVRPVGTAVLQGMIAGLLVTYVFQEVFFVRLP